MVGTDHRFNVGLDVPGPKHLKGLPVKCFDTRYVGAAVSAEVAYWQPVVLGEACRLGCAVEGCTSWIYSRAACSRESLTMCAGVAFGVMVAVADAGDCVTAGLLVSPAGLWALGEVQPANSKAASTVAMNTLMSCPHDLPTTEQVAAPDGRSGLDPVDSSYEGKALPARITPPVPACCYQVPRRLPVPAGVKQSQKQL